jgi:hypothetical protein
MNFTNRLQLIDFDESLRISQRSDHPSAANLSNNEEIAMLNNYQSSNVVEKMNNGNDDDDIEK